MTVTRMNWGSNATLMDIDKVLEGLGPESE